MGFVSLSGALSPETGDDPNHQYSQRFKESNGFKRLGFSHKWSDIDAYDAIFLPGGLGLLKDMVDNPSVKDIIKKVYESARMAGDMPWPSSIANRDLTKR